MGVLEMARQRKAESVETQQQKAHTPTVRLKPDMQKKVAILSIHLDKTAADLLDPIIRPKILAMYQEMLDQRGSN